MEEERSPSEKGPRMQDQNLCTQRELLVAWEPGEQGESLALKDEQEEVEGARDQGTPTMEDLHMNLEKESWDETDHVQPAEERLGTSTMTTTGPRRMTTWSEDFLMKSGDQAQVNQKTKDLRNRRWIHMDHVQPAGGRLEDPPVMITGLMKTSGCSEDGMMGSGEQSPVVKVITQSNLKHLGQNSKLSHKMSWGDTLKGKIYVTKSVELIPKKPRVCFWEGHLMTQSPPGWTWSKENKLDYQTLGNIIQKLELTDLGGLNKSEGNEKKNWKKNHSQWQGVRGQLTIGQGAKLSHWDFHTLAHLSKGVM